MGNRRQSAGDSECDCSRGLWQRERKDIASDAISHTQPDAVTKPLSQPDAESSTFADSESNTDAYADTQPNSVPQSDALADTDSTADRWLCGNNPMRNTMTLRPRGIALSFALLLLAALPIVAPITGCGSASSKVSTTGTSATTRNTAKGRATFTFLWPKRTTSRLIPVDANSIQVKVLAADGTVTATQLIARPTNGATSAMVTFDNLYVGTYIIVASAFPNADGSGNAQSQAQTSATILQGQTTPFTLTLASTITSLALTSSTTTLVTGQTVTLIPTATDAQGNVVLVSPSTLQWSSSASSVASIDANGVVTATASGSATITVTETESGKSASATLTVSNVASTSLPKATNFQINASHTGSISFGLPLNFPSSPTWSVGFSGPLSYPVIAGGKVFVVVGSPSGIPTTTGPKLYALDAATGHTIWGPIPLANDTTSYSANLTYENGKVFTISESGLIKSFDATTGTPGWSTQLKMQYYFIAAPVSANGIFYVTGSGTGSTMYAVNETNGNVLWTQPVYNGTSGSPTVGLDASGKSTGVYASYPCNVYDFNPQTGAALWHINGACDFGDGLTPVYANGSLYVRDFFQTGAIYNAATGASAGSFNSTPIPAINTTTGFDLNGNTLRGIDLASKSVLWSFTGNGDLTSAPLVIDQTVIVGGTSGTVYALDVITGTQKWSGNAGAAVSAPNESGGGPMNGISAGEGYLVVPAGSQLTAWHIAGQ